MKPGNRGARRQPYRGVYYQPRPPGPPGQYPPVYGPGMPPPIQPAQPPPEKSFFRRIGLAGWSALLLIPFLILLGVFLLVVFVGRPYIVHGSSMLPTLHDGDRVFVVPYRGNTTPDRGDIVVIKEMTGDNEMLIKRVIALAGDKITVGNGQVVVNDKYAHRSSIRASGETYNQLVPDSTLYVMGDNEGRSYDSRSFGPVPQSKIVGKALVIFWPLNDLKKL